MKKTFTLSQPLVRVVFLIVTIALCHKAAYSQATYYDTYAFRIPLTTNNTSLGIATDQTNFVALLKVVSPNFITGPCSNPTGGSSSVPPFAIIDSAYSTSTELFYQVENWDSTTGTIYFWVRVPTLYKTGSPNGNNKFYVYFGPTAGTAVSHTTAWQKQTWSNVTAAAGITYGGVYHFNEDPSGPAPQFADGTVHSNDVSTVSTGTVTQNTASEIGNGITLSATSVMAIGVTGMPNTQTDQSLSLWASYPSTPPHTANFIVLENSTNPATTGNGTQLGVLVEAAVTPLPRVQTWRWANRKTPLVQYGTAPSVNVWHHYAYTYKASTLQSWLYIDGVLVTGPTSNSANPPFSGSVDMVSFGDYINNNIGGSGLHTVGGQSYTGTMDEAHIVGCTLTADWVKAEYVNQSTASTFTTAGPMQTNSARASLVAGYLTYTWKGVSTDPASASNWNNTTTGVNNEVPVNSNVNWIIPAGLSKYPTLTASNGCHELSLGAGAYVNLNGFTLGIGCNIYNSSGGQILYNSSNTSTINWDGALSSQYYYGTNTAGTCELGSMTVNNSVAGTINITGGPVDIFSQLTMTKGNLVIGSSPASLTLKSTSTQTANVGAIPLGSSITGTVNAERFIKGSYPTDISKRGYRLMSSTVYTGTVGGNNVFDLSWLANGAIITGPAGGGFFSVGNPSAYIYREDILPSNANFTTGDYKGIAAINNTPSYNIGTQKWQTLSNTNDTTVNLTVGNGVLFFFRGNKVNNGSTGGTKTSLPYNYPEDVTFTNTGTLNTGTVNIKLWYKQDNYLGYTNSAALANASVRGYCLVGNPYASTINWEKYNRNSTVANSSIYGGGGLSSTIYMFNPTNKQYEAYMQKAGAIVAADTTTNLDPGTAVGSASNMIASGQGFFVRASAATQTLSFRETAKTTSQPSSAKLNLLMGTPKGSLSAEEPLIRLQMAEDSINTDEIVVRLNDKASTAYSISEDAQDMGGLSPQVSLSVMSSDSVKLAIDVLPFPKKAAQVIPIYVDAVASGPYQLKLTQLSNLSPAYQVMLRDHHLQDSVIMQAGSSYSFDIDKSDSSTFACKRFELVIKQEPQNQLKLVAFGADKTSGGSLISWKVKNEYNTTTFYVERSTDKGQTFLPIGSMQSNKTNSYDIVDKSPVKGENQYRLKLLDINDNISHSNIATVFYASVPNNHVNLTIYPNPAASSINLSVAQDKNFSSFKTDAYDVKIVNTFGLVVKKGKSQQASWHANIGDLLPGTYMVQVTNSRSKTLIGVTSFVKD
jgi:trimeric autotransporter adhesin